LRTGTKRSWCRLSVAALAVACMWPSGAIARMPDPTVPKGLSAVDWSAIHQEYDRHRRAMFASAGGYRARSISQHWLAQFDGRGFDVRPDEGSWYWGLQLSSYGFAGTKHELSGAAGMTVNVEQARYQWDPTLVEWFINEPDGLEHGFTLARRPSGAKGPLSLDFKVRGDWQTRLAADGLSVQFVDRGGTPRVLYSGLQATDAAGHRLQAWMRAEAAGFHIEVQEDHAVYPIRIDPIAQQAYVKASNTDSYDEFGYSVAVSGDTVVVGAIHESSSAIGVNGDQANNSALNAGAAYVFVRSAGAWSEQAYLKASNTTAGFEFGNAVAISGDTIVVGSHLETSSTTGVNSTPNTGLSGAGAAYVFFRTGGIWSQQAYLKGDTTNSSDEFGRSVAVSGDTVAVGVPAPSTLNDRAYVFVSNAGVWSQQVLLKSLHRVRVLHWRRFGHTCDRRRRSVHSGVHAQRRCLERAGDSSGFQHTAS
jgi:hypothetical protein